MTTPVDTLRTSIRRRGIPVAAPDISPEPPEWAESALCAQIGSDLFFPEKGGSTSDARAICSRCAVRIECLTEAMAIEPFDYLRFGIYGGLTPRERTKLSRSGWRAGDPVPPVRMAVA